MSAVTLTKTAAKIKITKTVTVVTARMGHKPAKKQKVHNKAAKGRKVATASSTNKGHDQKDNSCGRKAETARKATGQKVVTGSRANARMAHLGQKAETARKEATITDVITTGHGLITQTETITHHLQGPNK